MKSIPGVDLSIVLPVRNEAENVEPLIEELVSVIEGLKLSYEILVINSPGIDNSWEVLKELADRFEYVYPIDATYLYTKGLQKGYQYMLGFSCAKGKRVVQMDSDYQDDPKDIPMFLKKLDEGFDLVVGWKQDRKDPFMYKLTSKVQNTLTRFVSGVHVHDKNCGFKAYSRAAVESVNLYGMNYRDIPFQLSSKGFRVAEVPITNRKRLGGKSNFNFMNRLIGGTLDFSSAMFTSMMLDTPFRLWGGVGMLKLFAGLMMLGVFIVWILFTGGSVSFNWWAALWLALACLEVIVGVVFLAVGIVTEYIRSLQPFNRTEYHIIEDYKGRLEQE